MTDLLRSINHQGARRAFRSCLLGAAALTLGAIVAVWLSPDRAGGLLIGAVLVMFAGFRLVAARRARRNAARLDHALTHDPRSIVWAYGQSRRFSGTKAEPDLVVLGFRDGWLVALRARDESLQDRLLAAVRRLSPSAVVGFSPETRDAFVRNPSGLAGD